MRLQGERITICDLKLKMAKELHLNSLDEETRKYLPDEVFEDVVEAKETIEYLVSRLKSDTGPYVYAIMLGKEMIGYVQLVYLEDDYEIGFHIGEKYRNQGYASEALKLFLPKIMKEKHLNVVEGICLKENIASKRVLEKCNFELVYEGRGHYQGTRQEICVFTFKL